MLKEKLEEVKHSEHCHKEASEKLGFKENTLKLELEQLKLNDEMYK